MLTNWAPYGAGKPEIKGVLNLIIKDPLNDELIPYPLLATPTTYPKAEEGNAKWDNDNDPRIPLNIQMLQNMIKGSIGKICHIEIGDALKPKSFFYKVTLTDLKPSKLYTILVKNFFIY